MTDDDLGKTHFYGDECDPPHTPAQRCPWAIQAGQRMATRCLLPAEHDDDHVGRGMSRFPYQRLSWLRGDSREFMTDRDDTFSWNAPWQPGQREELEQELAKIEAMPTTHPTRDTMIGILRDMLDED